MYIVDTFPKVYCGYQAAADRADENHRDPESVHDVHDSPFMACTSLLTKITRSILDSASLMVFSNTMPSRQKSMTELLRAALLECESVRAAARATGDGHG